MVRKSQNSQVSLVIPCYNEEKAILKCLESVFAQKRPFKEVVVVDNNSSDNSVKLIRENYPEVKLLQENKQGVTYARDRGFDAVKGDIIARIDVDTYLPVDWTLRLEHIFSDEDISAVSGPVFYTDMPGKKIGKDVESFLRDAFSHDVNAPFLLGANMALRRKAWLKVKKDVCRDDIKLHEDVDLAIHLARAGEKVIFDKKLVAGVSARRIDDDPISFYKYLKMNRYSYECHGITTVVGAAPIIIYSLAYPGIKLIRRAYDPDIGKLSLTKLMSLPETARKNPMA